MNITAMSLSYFNKSGEQNDQADLVAVKATMQVIQNHLLNIGTFFTLTLCCRNQHTCKFFNNLLEKLFHMWGMSMVRFVVLKENSTERVGGDRRSNLIMTDSFKAFREIHIASYTSRNNYNEFYYIFLQIRDAYLQENLQQIFEYCWAHSMINCSVQVQNSHGIITVYSYFPFTNHYCAHVEPVIINRFNGTDFERPLLFPLKLKNFHGCAVRAALQHIPPFVYLDTDGQGNKRIVGGIEGHLLKQLSKLLNFTIEIKTPQEKRYHVDALEKDEVDITLGCFSQTSALMAVASYVTSYYQTSQVLCVSRQAYALNSLEAFTTPFDGTIWLLTSLTGIVCWALCFALSKYWRHSFERRMQTFLNFLAVLLGMSITHTPYMLQGRLLFITWLCFTLLIRSIYQGVLFTYAHRSTIVSIPTDFEELVELNFTVVMSSVNKRLLSDVPLMQKLPSITTTRLDGVSAFDYIRHMSKRNYVAVGPLDFLLFYELMHNKTGHFVVMSKDLLNFQITMYLQKHSYLIDQFEHEIWWIRSAGLISGWTLNEVGEMKIAKDEKKIEVIHLQDLSAIFYMFVIGMLASLAVFALEMLSLRLRPLRSVF